MARVGYLVNGLLGTLQLESLLLLEPAAQLQQPLLAAFLPFLDKLVSQYSEGMGGGIWGVGQWVHVLGGETSDWAVKSLWSDRPASREILVREGLRISKSDKVPGASGFCSD